MRLGIFAKTFAGTDPDQVLAAVRAAGYRCTQFNMACAGLPPMPKAVPDDVVRRIAAAADRHGVDIVALSGTYNMSHPDKAVRADGLRRLRVVIAAAKTLAVPLVTLCTGTRDPADQWRHHPGNAEPDAWADLLREMEQAIGLADAAGVDLGVEPEQANVVASAAAARKLIESMHSPRLRIVLDPANLFERATRDEARRLVGEAVGLLGDRIAMAHAKDRYADGRFATAGHGVVDFPDFLARLRTVGFEGPLVAHGLEAHEAPAVSAHFKNLGVR